MGIEPEGGDDLRILLSRETVYRTKEIRNKVSLKKFEAGLNHSLIRDAGCRNERDGENIDIQRYTHTDRYISIYINNKHICNTHSALNARI